MTVRILSLVAGYRRQCRRGNGKRCGVELPERDSNGQLPAYAWPGGYPLIYLTGDGLTVCPDCASKDDTSDPATACYVHWEGEPIDCDDCGKSVESAYGVPEGARRGVPFTRCTD